MFRVRRARPLEPDRRLDIIWEKIMEAPPGLKYSKEHEWVATEESVATIGITDHAQEQLGEIVYIELPSVGEKVSKDDPFGVVESVKAVSDIYAPVSGTVVEVNEDLPESPEVVNEDPYGDGWLIKVKVSDPDDFDDLMDNDEYAELVAREKES
jgi:glycine cleavage system H protein